MDMNDLRALLPAVNGEPVDSSTLPVMPQKCPTCPFGDNDVLGVRKAIEVVLMEGVRICHKHELNGFRGNFICRGAFDEQCEIFYRMGVVSAPTQEAWDQKRREVGMPERRNYAE